MFDWEKLGLSNVETIVDIGAAKGDFLAPACAYYKPKRWYAIEMLADRCQELKARTDIDQSIGNILNAAIGDEDTTMHIGRTQSLDSSSLLTINPKSQDWFSTLPGGMDQHHAEEIHVYPLDGLFIPKPIDLMKIDVQGYEGRLIKGGPRTLQNTKAVLIEVLFVEHYFGQSTPREINDGLLNLGFEHKLWLNEAYSRHGELTQKDGFYVRP